MKNLGEIDKDSHMVDKNIIEITRDSQMVDKNNIEDTPFTTPYLLILLAVHHLKVITVSSYHSI